jgi:hypothetical protein
MAVKLLLDERRLFARFKAKEGSLVVANNMIGLIEDVSLGGLSFKYFHKDQPSLDGKAVEVVLPCGNMQIPVSHYEVVAITPHGKALLANDQAQIRQYHLRFKGFTGEELRKFWRMIQKNCTKFWAGAEGIPNSRRPHRGKIFTSCAL